MPRARPARPREVPKALPARVADEGTQRALDDLADRQQADRPSPSAVIVCDLEPGLNKVPHGLGRAVRHASIAPTYLNPNWAWAIVDEDNPIPDREVWIDTTGARQPGARIRVE